jgi:predicted ATPase
MRVFLSYRRDDAAGHAGRIADHLVARYGPDAVFMDVETIEAGADFVEAIDQAIAGADAVLVVIGPGWVEARDAVGRRRLDDPTDFVRIEVEAALAREVRSIPVLVGGATMPAPEELPASIAPLARMNGVELVDRRFLADVEDLVRALERRNSRPGSGEVHLPPQPTPFVGRADEVERLRDLLSREDVRLVTLTGPGGAGKTRLSIEAASGLADRYPDGIWFVGLVTIRDPALVASTIAASLGLREGAGSSIEETLERHLAERHLLLVVDNLEQLLPDVATTLASLVETAPGLELLASSREPLGVRAEHVFPVGELAAADATALFAERAWTVDPGFALDGTTTPLVEAICQRLENLPLAIELAAARVKVLSLAELLDRLQDRLPILVGGARDAPERQRTMRATIAWSHDLLPAAEQALFARLAVFRGGCTLEAAEAVCDADLDAMASLVDKSLLRTEERPAGSTRYRALETIREFATERLDQLPDAHALRDAHVRHVLAFATDALAGLKGRGQEVWLERLEAEHDNLRSALRWSLDEGSADAALELAATAWYFWYMHGHVTEGRRWLTEALDRAAPMPTEPRALALAGAGWLAGEQGDLSMDLFEAALRCAREADASPTTTAIALSFLGGYLLDDPERALRLSAEAVEVARAGGDRWMWPIAMNNLAEHHRERGDAARATQLYEESYRIAEETGDTFHLSLYRSNLGEMALKRGDLETARDLFSRVHDAARLQGDRRHLATSLLDLGWVSLAQDRYEEAGRWFREALVLQRELGGLPQATSALAGLAAVAAAAGDDEGAGRLVGAASALEDRVGVLPTPPDAGAHEPYLAAARVRAGDGWDRSVAEGRAMDTDRAIDGALS